MDTTNNITKLYTSDEYIEKHPDLHEEDTSWKVMKLKPFLDEFVNLSAKKNINILDVGGGAGELLKQVSVYLKNSHNCEVIKSCLDLSPGMVDRQKEKNPDIKFAKVGDIRNTDFDDKQFDLVLMIDVLEHVPEPQKALKEISRISNFAIFKVPLENTLYYKLMDLITRGGFRKRIIEYIGHINVYSKKSLISQISKYCGEDKLSGYTNVYPYLLKIKKNLFDKIFNTLGSLCYKLSPNLATKIFSDYLIVLVKCNKNSKTA